MYVSLVFKSSTYSHSKLWNCLCWLCSSCLTSETHLNHGDSWVSQLSQPPATPENQKSLSTTSVSVQQMWFGFLCGLDDGAVLGGVTDVQCIPRHTSSTSQIISREKRMLQNLGRGKNQRNLSKTLNWRKIIACDGFVGLEIHFLGSL